MIVSDPALPTRRASGFSLVELAIGIAVITVLAVTILASASYLIGEARRGNALKLLDGMRSSARQYSQREKNGLSFAGLGWTQGACPTNPQTIPGLRSDCSLRTPWESNSLALLVEATAAGCSGDTCFRACIAMPDTECAILQPSITGAFSAACVTDSTGSTATCSLTGGTGTWLVVIGR